MHAWLVWHGVSELGCWHVGWCSCWSTSHAHLSPHPHPIHECRPCTCLAGCEGEPTSPPSHAPPHPSPLTPAPLVDAGHAPRRSGDRHRAHCNGGAAGGADGGAGAGAPAAVRHAAREVGFVCVCVCVCVCVQVQVHGWGSVCAQMPGRALEHLLHAACEVGLVCVCVCVCKFKCMVVRRCGGGRWSTCCMPPVRWGSCVCVSVCVRTCMLVCKCMGAGGTCAAGPQHPSLKPQCCSKTNRPSPPPVPAGVPCCSRSRCSTPAPPACQPSTPSAAQEQDACPHHPCLQACRAACDRAAQPQRPQHASRGHPQPVNPRRGQRGGAVSGAGARHHRRRWVWVRGRGRVNVTP